MIYEFIQSGGKPVDFFRCMSCRQRYAQPRPPPGDGRIANRWNEDPLFAQGGGGLDGFLFVTD